MNQIENRLPSPVNCSAGEVYKQPEEFANKEQQLKALGDIANYCPKNCYRSFGVNDCRILKYGRHHVKDDIETLNFR